MRGFSIHLGRHSALAEQRPLRLIDIFRHSGGVAIWTGPVGLIVYSR